MNFPVWKTIKIGHIGPYYRALDMLKSAGINVTTGHAPFDHIVFEKEERMIDLILASPKDLGVTRQMCYAKFYEMVSTAGLSICPPETAIALLVQEPDFAVPDVTRTWCNSSGGFQIAMKPIPTTARTDPWGKYHEADNHCEFYVGPRWLGTSHQSHFGGGDAKPLVFVRKN